MGTPSETILKIVAGVLRPILREIHKRLADLESQRGMRYRGVYQCFDTYRAGDFASHDGCLWHACRDTSETPGTGSDWQMAVKRGNGG